MQECMKAGFYPEIHLLMEFTVWLGAGVFLDDHRVQKRRAIFDLTESRAECEEPVGGRGICWLSEQTERKKRKGEKKRRETRGMEAEKVGCGKRKKQNKWIRDRRRRGVACNDRRVKMNFSVCQVEPYIYNFIINPYIIFVCSSQSHQNHAASEVAVF